MSINCRKRVVEQVHITVVVNCPCKANSLLLSTRKVDPLFPNLRPVAVWKNFKIRSEGTRIQNSAVHLLVVFPAKGDVVFQAGVLHPRLLWNVGHASTDVGTGPKTHLFQVIGKGGQEGGLAGAD